MHISFSLNYVIMGHNYKWQRESIDKWPLAFCTIMHGMHALYSMHAMLVMHVYTVSIVELNWCVYSLSMTVSVHCAFNDVQLKPSSHLHSY